MKKKIMLAKYCWEQNNNIIKQINEYKNIRLTVTPCVLNNINTMWTSRKNL